MGWQSSAWLPTPSSASGGGGGEWEVVDPRPMTGNALELFTVGTDDVIKLVLCLEYSSIDIPTLSLSVDGGLTYPNTHDWTAREQTTTIDTFHGTKTTNSTTIWLYDASTQRLITNGEIQFFGISDSGALTLARFESTGGTSSSCGDTRGSARFDTAGVVNKIKVATQAGSTMDAGTITLLKRTY